MERRGYQAVARAKARHVEAAVAHGWARDTAAAAVETRDDDIRRSLVNAAVTKAEQRFESLLKKKGATAEQRAKVLEAKRRQLAATFERVFGLPFLVTDGWPGLAELHRIAAARPGAWRVSESALDLALGDGVELRLELDSSGRDLLWARPAKNGRLIAARDAVAVADRRTWDRRCPAAWLSLLENAARDHLGPHGGDWGAILAELAVFSGLEGEVVVPSALGGMRFDFARAYIAGYTASTRLGEGEDSIAVASRLELVDGALDIQIPELLSGKPSDVLDATAIDLIESSWDQFLGSLGVREVAASEINIEVELRTASIGSRLYSYVVLVQDGYVFRFYVTNLRGEDHWDVEDSDSGDETLVAVRPASAETWKRLHARTPPRGFAGFVVPATVNESALVVAATMLRGAYRTLREAPIVIEDIRATLVAAYEDLQKAPCAEDPYEQTLDALVVAGRLFEQATRHAELGRVPTTVRARLEPVAAAVRQLAASCTAGQSNLVPITVAPPSESAVDDAIKLADAQRRERSRSGEDVVDPPLVKHPVPDATPPDPLWGKGRVDPRAMVWAHRLLRAEPGAGDAVRLAADALIFTQDFTYPTKTRTLLRVPTSVENAEPGSVHPLPGTMTFRHWRDRAIREVQLDESGLAVSGFWGTETAAAGEQKALETPGWPDLIVEDATYRVVHEPGRIAPVFRALGDGGVQLTTSPTLGVHFENTSGVRIAPRFVVPRGECTLGAAQVEALASTRSPVEWINGFLGKGPLRASWNVFSGQDFGVRWWLGTESRARLGVMDGPPTTWKGADVAGLTFSIGVPALRAAITALGTYMVTVTVTHRGVTLTPERPDDEEQRPVELVGATVHAPGVEAVERASIHLHAGNISDRLQRLFLFGPTVQVRVVPSMSVGHLVIGRDPGERPALIMYQRGDADCPARHVQAALAQP